MSEHICVVEPMLKVNRPKFLGQQNRIVETRAQALGNALHTWMLQYARFRSRREIASLMGRGSFISTFAKADQDEEAFRARLSRILETYGVRQVISAARRATGQSELAVPPRALREWIAAKEVKVQGILDQTNAQVQASLRTIVGNAIDEQPRPSAAEVARRIRSQFHGVEGGQILEGDRLEAVTPQGLRGTNLIVTRDEDGKQTGGLYAFSAERAALIARTELAQAQNTGTFEGYRAIGIKYKQWLSYRDGRSGARRHDKMHRKTAKLDEPFILPSGARLMYPGDPSAPISETANCRCALASLTRGVTR